MAMQHKRGLYRVVFSWLAWAALASMIASLATVAGAQSISGSIYGTVTDSSGAVIPGARISATNVATGETFHALSNSTGDFGFPTVKPGEYTVAAQYQGFQVEVQNNVVVDANQNVHANFALKAGSTAQSVVVSAETTMVDTREAQVAGTIDQQRIEDLPSVNRNAYGLLKIVPGVTLANSDTQTGSRFGATVNINGINVDEGSYYLDGGYDTAGFTFGGMKQPNPDALQEFRTITSNFDAEFGRSPGIVVNSIVRSGTNQFHGLAYNYLRNTAFDAQTYFVTGGVTSLHQNQYGGNFGGPLPHLRDKAFFFVSYEGLRVHTPDNTSPGAMVMPTTLERTGDFSQSPTKPILPATTINGNGNVVQVQCGTAAAPKICPDALDPVAQNVLKVVPVGNSSPSDYGHPPQQLGNANINNDEGLVRVDYRLGEKHQLSGMFFESRGQNYNPGSGSASVFGYYGVALTNNVYNGALGDNWLISANKVNTIRAFYALDHYFVADENLNQNTLESLGSNAPEAIGPYVQPLITVTGYWTMGQGANVGAANAPSSDLGLSDSFIWTHGRHQVKFGGSYMWERLTITAPLLSSGSFTFSKRSAKENALVNFLLGQATTFTQNNGEDYNLHEQAPSLYLQDDWQVIPDLTLNLGLRWEYFPTFAGQNNTQTFVPYQQSTRFPTAPLGLVTSGDKGIPDGIQKTPLDTFAPRFGFAYDVFGNGKTALRGAFGIFYGALPFAMEAIGRVGQPFQLSISTSNTPNLVNPYAPNPDPFPYAANPSNAVFTSGGTIFAMPPGFNKTYTVAEYNLSLQQQLSPGWSAQLAYVGNAQRHSQIHLDEDAPIYSPSCTSATCLGTAKLNARRPYNLPPYPHSSFAYATITEQYNEANASYNSLQATLTRRFDQHFSLQASYVWSKGVGINDYFPDKYRISTGYGVLSRDQTHQFAASYIYVLPDIHSLGVFGKEVLDGWQVNGITTIHSGMPDNVLSGVDSNFDGNSYDHPNQVGDPHLGRRGRSAEINEWFNTAAFAQVPLGTATGDGDVGYNTLRGPGFINTDLSAFKSFPMAESLKLEFRAEAFNAFNHTNLGDPNLNLSSPLFGKIGSANGVGRILQFALRLSF
jgi:Carboxypeptidase regulatory-like domain/TonB-dependent Receptor Plug Domain